MTTSTHSFARTALKSTTCMALALSPAIALATTSTLGTLAANVVGTFSQIVSLITAISYVAGMGFALAGIMKFKSHRDNPQQVPLSAPIVLVIVAAALLFMPAILKTTGATIFGSQAGNGVGQTTGFTDFQ